MTAMTKKDLRRIVDLDKKINCLLDEVSRLEHDLCTVRGMDYGSGVRGTSPSSFDGLIAKICDLQKRVNDEIDVLIGLRAKAKDSIDRLDGVYYIVMSKRYLQGKVWHDIAMEMHYSESHVLRIHGEALKRLSKTE